MRVVFSFSLDSLKVPSQPRFVISTDLIMQQTPRNFAEKIGEFFLLLEPQSFAPSGIERHPLSGTFFILSARSGILIELSPGGNLIKVVELSPRLHTQAEGITFLPDNTLVICDEGNDRKARITFYPPDR
jgi:uncharacterized protein YjiK